MLELEDLELQGWFQWMHDKTKCIGLRFWEARIQLHVPIQSKQQISYTLKWKHKLDSCINKTQIVHKTKTCGLTSAPTHHKEKCLNISICKFHTFVCTF
jgi:hypothetical protein